MRAAVTWVAGERFVVSDAVDRRAPGPGELVVGIKAAGVCQTDVSLSKEACGQQLPH